MFRAGPKVSAHDKLEKQQQQQKQKKRLSFREPEIVGPQRQGDYRSKVSLSAVPTKALESRRGSSSVEDLTLEDQALNIVHSVGNAFLDLPMKVNDRCEYSDQVPYNNNSEIPFQGTTNTSCSSLEYTSYQRKCQQRSFKISAGDEKYLDSAGSPPEGATMRCPIIESREGNQNCNLSDPQEDTYPRGSQHQIQLLKYQLDQQNQQTQMALFQVQLLTDQMEAESNARRKAQDQNNQLMMQNRDLLEHIEKLFLQIEDLERKVHVLEQEKNTSGVSQDSQVIHKPLPSYAGFRRLSSDQIAPEKSANTNRSQISTKKSTLSTAKSTTPVSKPASHQNLPSSRRSSLTQPRQYSTQTKTSDATASSKQYPSQSKSADASNKSKDFLRIGDTSPPVQSGTMTPFGSGWKLNAPTPPDKTVGMPPRSRTGSFSSYSKLKAPESPPTKNTLFSNSNNFSNASSKKYSSSTSDLYSNQSSYQMTKPLVIDEPLTSTKSSISNLNLTPPSKLPRYQAFSSFQRKASLSDSEQFSPAEKDKFKSKTETSLFNR
ncbi:capon-like protein [Uloborus diversus]|uniref:capon-like protein n=1 Tax=Uloborus diversus TaxID=327109 RepID=UPI0024094AD4|nr:capon-like protein [Uloborus diversus]